MQRLVARLRPGDDLHEQAADAHAGDVLARHRQPGEEPHQHPVEAVLLRAAGAAGRAEHRVSGRRADHQQIAGIDRHAEMLDAAADRFERRGNHVAPVGDGRSAEDDGHLGARLEHFFERLARARLDSCGTRRSATMLAPAGASRSAVIFSVFSITLPRARAARSRRCRPCERDKARPATAAAWRAASAASRAAPATANGMIFTVAIISPATTGL